MITSASNGRIKYLDTLMQKSKFRKKEGKFVAEGIKMFEEAPKEDILEIYVMESAYKDFDKDVKKKLERFTYELVTDSVFKKVSDTVTPQGILTVLKTKDNSIEEIISDKNALIMVLENVQDPGNIGTIIRTAEGAGATGIILTKDCVDIYSPKVIRSTMGSIFRSKIAVTDDILNTLSILKEKDIKSYAFALDNKAKTYDSYDYTNPCALVIGNEGNRLKKETVEACDNTCFIPMAGKVESLNASVAASIAMYEVARQRR